MQSAICVELHTFRLSNEFLVFVKTDGSRWVLHTKGKRYDPRHEFLTVKHDRGVWYGFTLLFLKQARYLYYRLKAPPSPQKTWNPPCQEVRRTQQWKNGASFPKSHDGAEVHWQERAAMAHRSNWYAMPYTPHYIPPHSTDEWAKSSEHFKVEKYKWNIFFFQMTVRFHTETNASFKNSSRLGGWR